MTARPSRFRRTNNCPKPRLAPLWASAGRRCCVETPQSAAMCFRVYTAGASHGPRHHQCPTPTDAAQQPSLPRCPARSTRLRWACLLWGDAPTMYTRQVRASGLGRLYRPAVETGAGPTPRRGASRIIGWHLSGTDAWKRRATFSGSLLPPAMGENPQGPGQNIPYAPASTGGRESRRRARGSYDRRAHSPYRRILAFSVLRDIPRRRLASLRLPPARSRAVATSLRSYSSRAA